MKYSVVIPAHNAENYLACALDSVRSQRLSPEAIIVVDDGSSDATARIAKAYHAIVISNKIAQGPSAARNAGVAASSTELIAFLDADDEWTPEHTELTVAALARHGVVFSAASAMHIGDASGAVAAADVGSDPLDLRDILILDSPIIQSGVVIRRDVFDEAGRYDESMRYAEDYDLWCRVAELGLFCPVGAASVRRRIHAEQATTRFTQEMAAGAWEVRRRTAARRLRACEGKQHSDILQLLCEGARRDIGRAVWTGEPQLLSVVRKQLEKTDNELKLRGVLAAIGGTSFSMSRFFQNMRCQAYGMRAMLRSHRGLSAT